MVEKHSNPEVQKLADSLKSSGLAASMMDAIEKAKSIIGIQPEETKKMDEEIENAEPMEEPVQEKPQETIVDVQQPEVVEEAPGEGQGTLGHGASGSSMNFGQVLTLIQNMQNEAKEEIRAYKILRNHV